MSDCSHLDTLTEITTCINDILTGTIFTFSHPYRHHLHILPSSQTPSSHSHILIPHILRGTIFKQTYKFYIVLHLRIINSFTHKNIVLHLRILFIEFFRIDSLRFARLPKLRLRRPSTAVRHLECFRNKYSRMF